MLERLPLTHDDLWDAARDNQIVDPDLLPETLRTCVEQGDEVADHYGGRTNFTFLNQKDTRILTLELSDSGVIQARDVINMSCGYGTGILGDKIAEIGQQLPNFLVQSTTTNDEFHSLERRQLVRNIKGMIGAHTATSPDSWEITFTSTGSEAMDLALQLACLDGFDLARGIDTRAEKDVIIACHGAWHGWSLGTNQMLDRRQFTDGLPRVQSVETAYLVYGDMDHLETLFETYKGRIRAVFVEGILGDGGIIPASDAWWDSLFEHAAAEDAKVFDDEILTGFRTGNILALPKGRVPDCISLGKALGFGLFPMSALAWRKDRLRLRAGIGVRTFNARPFQAATVNAGLDYIARHELIEHSARLGHFLLDGLKSVQAEHPEVFKEARGQGLFAGLELSKAFARKGHLVRNELVRHGVLTETESGLFNRKVPKEARINETIRLTPPLTIHEDTLTEAMSRISQCAKTLKSA